ncbi:cytochrome P450 4C1-like [Spodoptera frugiperda]|uniref:Cytochrome P450 4C1-like n=1 Tax=Spodoptera frugiperda TaxID=7108 RepID=A0A9R0EXT2_SPOFR|nr:cytochrome P450 4C1-like [Spodoptera frugiperda]
MVVAVYLICFVVISVWLWVRSRRLMPPVVPGALPLIGHMHRFLGLESIWNTIEETSKFSLENGGISILKICEHNVYMLTDPDLSLMAFNISLNKMFLYHFTKDLMGNGLVTSDAQTWKIHRKLINPAFNQQVLNSFINEMNVQSKWLVSELSTKLGKSVNVRKPLIKFTMNITSRISLGLNAEDQTLIDKDYAHAFEVLSVIYYERGTKPWLHVPFIFNRSALKRKQDKLTETLTNILNPVIHKRRLEMKMNSYNNNENDDKFKPLLNHLLYLADEQNAFSDTEIREHLNTFVIAAYDTSTVSLTLLLMMIGWHKGVQERVYNEIQEVLNNEDRDFTKNDLPKLVYLEAVIKETLRCYPTIPIIGRQVDVDMKLGKYTIPAGSSCGVSLHGIHRHPMWGPDADQFNPDRWLDPARLPNLANAFVAFGVGKRYCIGKTYTMMLMKIAVGHIVRQYHVQSDLSRLRFQFEGVLQPTKGHRITFTKRT